MADAPATTTPIAASDSRSDAEVALDRMLRERPDKMLALELRVETLRHIKRNHRALMRAMVNFAKGDFPKDVPAQALKAQSDLLKAMLDKLTVTVRENEQSGGDHDRSGGATSPVTIVFKGVSGPRPVDGQTIEVGD